MIKIKDYESILKSVYNNDVLQASANIFKLGLQSQSPTNEYVRDFCQMGLTQPILQNYYNEGLSVLMPAVNSKKKLDISMVPTEYIVYTGLLNHEFVVGYDTTKGMSTSIYTKNEQLLEKLFKAGAFDNEEKYRKNMKALFGEGKQEFGNKIVTSFEKNSLAMARLDISAVVGDEVSLDLIVPSKFRDDYGRTFKLYPYAVFPFLSEALIDFVGKMKEGSFSERNRKVVDVRGLTILQAEEEGNVKNRKVVFNANELVKAYRRGKYNSMDESEEAQNMLKNQVAKTKIKWDCLKLYLKGFNLEASLYSIPYTTIRFERVVSISPCSLRDIDTSMYMVDFDSVRRLFRARVNSWRLEDFKEFNKIVNTDDCMNIPDRRQVIDVWSNNMDDADLLKIMKMKRNLFEVDSNGNTKTIEDGLDDMYRQKPRASKNLQLVALETDFNRRKVQVKDLLNKGVCKIESVSSRTGAPRSYIATNCQAVLTASYGPNRLMAFESPKRAIDNLKTMIEEGKIGSYNAFVDKLFKAEIDGLVNYGALSESSVASDWTNVLEQARMDLDAKNTKSDGTGAGTTNPYIVNFRRINADKASEFYGAVDVRNIESIEFGEQKNR